MSQGDGAHSVIVLIPATSLFEYLMGRRALVNVPADAVCASVWIQPGLLGRPLRVALRLEHPTFKFVPHGARIPTLPAHCRLIGQ